ncbi:MAG: DinB family protein [Chitinophagaceae bacterium]|nr:MAG: DinB family protein [Chitinophagaceae bacterium]
MNENNRLKKLLADHFDGEPWIEVQILASLQGLTARDAAKNIQGLNSIWQIVHHMRCWRETLLRRLQGEQIPSPDNNYFEAIPVVSEKHWMEALEKLTRSQQALLHYLSTDIDMDEKPPGSVYSRYELLQGVLQHDAYHLGQVILIRKLLLNRNTGK